MVLLLARVQDILFWICKVTSLFAQRLLLNPSEIHRVHESLSYLGRDILISFFTLVYTTHYVYDSHINQYNVLAVI